MTKAQIEAVVNALLPSGLPITAAGQHRPSMQKLIDELFDAASRGRVLALLGNVVSVNSGDKFLLFRSGEAYLADRDLVGTGGGGSFVKETVSTAGATIALNLQSKERG